MRNAILSWYAFAASGAAGRDEPRDPNCTPDRLAELFGDARRLDAEMTPEGWQYLWSRYGLEGLIDLARQGGWPRETTDEVVADALVSESLAGGYDPVSGQFGALDGNGEFGVRRDAAEEVAV